MVINKNLVGSFVRATERAAYGASLYRGKGDKIAADQSAVDEMRKHLNTINPNLYMLTRESFISQTIKTLKINDGAGWDLYWDDNAQASYVYNAGQDIFSSFETTTSIALKAEWADAMGLGGMMFWDLSNDATDSPDSLISAAFRSMVLEEDVADIQSDSSLPDPIIVGGDGEIGPLPL